MIKQRLAFLVAHTEFTFHIDGGHRQAPRIRPETFGDDRSVENIDDLVGGEL